MEEILVRYFQGECSEEERQQAEEFKRSFPNEFTLLEKLWTNRERISVIDYDSQQAWDSVWTAISDTPQRKTRSMYYNLICWAAVIVLLITATVVILQNSADTMTVVGSGGNTQVSLADGTLVWLNDNATLTYPKEFTEFRKVILTGEAYFEVKRDVSRPFIIESNQVDVKVLGTSFNVRLSENGALVSVTSGLVEVQLKDGKSSGQFAKGEEAFVEKSTIVKQALSPNFQSWRTGEFVFENTPLPQAIKELKTYYKTGLNYAGDSVDCQLTARISKMKVEEVTELLQSVCE